MFGITQVKHSTESGINNSIDENNNIILTNTSPCPVNHLSINDQCSHISTWAYIKWYIWSTITGLFSCKYNIIKTELHDDRPSNEVSIETKELVDYNIPPEIDGHYLNDSPVLDYVDNCIEPSRETTANEGTDHVEFNNGTITKDFYIDIDGDSDTGVSCNPSDSNTKVSSEDAAHISYTLLDQYKFFFMNGILDRVTHDNFVQRLFNSIMPRNLSNSSHINVSNDARKLYVWDNVKTVKMLQYDEQDDNDNGQNSSDEVSPDYHRDVVLKQQTDNIVTNSSDHSFLTSLISVDGDMTNGGSNIDGSSNSCIEDGSQAEYFFENPKAGMLSGKSNDSPAVKYTRPPVPDSLERKSRSRSPVYDSGINSMRSSEVDEKICEFIPFDGMQLLNAQELHNIDLPKPKRSSSLKSSRTPPDTPTQKAVRFADALGLDLATVRHVFDSDAPPKIPASAIVHLNLDKDECIAKLGAKQYSLRFSQPGTSSNFIRRVLNNNISLENVQIDQQHPLLMGTICVRSLGFEKHVYIRITYNNWITFFDCPASYVQGSHDGATDRFSFSVTLPDTMVPGDKAQFAVCYETHKTEQFWDNNQGQNYIVLCYAKATDLAGDGSWMHYL